MKKFMLALSLSLAIGTIISLNSCKKTESTVADDSVSAKDNATVSNAFNATTDDAESAAGQVQSFSGKTEGWWVSAVMCGVSVVDSGTPGNRLITITYDNTTTCNGVIRSGTVTVQNTSGIPWRDANSVLNITFNNLKVTDPVTLQSYTLNGTHTLTKETAGLAWQVLYGIAPANTTVVRRNQGNLTVTFPDNSQRSWTVDRTRSWSNVGGPITVTVSSEAAGGVDVTGTNRYGLAFSNTIVTPIAANNQSGCTWRPYNGETVHTSVRRTTTVQYGCDRTGTHIGTASSCGNGNGYGVFISYTKANGNSGTIFNPYW